MTVASAFRRNAVRSPLATAITLAAVLLVGNRAVLAAVEPIISEVAVGYEGFYRAQRYVPVRVAIDWTGQPDLDAGDTGPRAAFVEVEINQDGLYRASTRRSIVLQPGQSTRTIIHVLPRAALTEIRARLLDERGRTLARWTSPANFGTWVAAVPGDDLLVLAVGHSTLPASGWLWERRAYSPFNVARVAPADSPRSWTGLDGVDVVVVGDLGIDTLDGEQLETLKRWLEWGGDLVVLVLDERVAYDTIFGDEAPAVEIGEYRAEPVPDALRATLLVSGAEALDVKVDATQADIGDDTGPTGYAHPLTAYRANWPVLKQSLDDARGATVYRRTFALTPETLRDGWVARWSHERHPWPQKSEPSAGDVVSGPWGIGSVTLLGADPSSLVFGAEEGARGVGWWHALRHVAPLNERIEAIHAGFATASLGAWAGNWHTDRAGALSQVASNARLDAVSQGIDVRRGLFGFIVLSLTALVLLVGPVDYLFLRRLQREPLTWLTCPLAVALACAVIYSTQEWFRTDRTSIRRASWVDVAPWADEAWATSVTAIVSSTNARYALDGLGAGRHVAPVGFQEWGAWYESEGKRVGIALAQSGDQTRMGSLRVPLDGVRWVEDRGFAARPEVLVRAFRGAAAASLADSRLHIAVATPYAGARLEGVAALWDGVWYESNQPADWAFHPATIVLSAAERESEHESRRREAFDEYWYNSPTWSRAWPHDLPFQSAGHVDVQRAAAQLGPDYASVIVRLDDVPAESITLTRAGLLGPSAVPIDGRQTLVLRMLVPVEERSAMPDAGAGAETSVSEDDRNQEPSP